MSNIAQVKQQVKFSLSQLADENGHHKFEHLCRNICRQRICTNILPATGPVSSGGDQGADFETFRTHISKEFGTSAFVGLLKDGKAVFTCSIQRSGIEEKIKGDVLKVRIENLNPDEIHFFSNQPIPVAKRHDLQSWARDNYKIHLEIYDIEAISEFLADYNLFWVAEQYLEIAPEVFPKPEDRKFENYYKKKEFFKKLTEPVYNFSEFQELKSSVRAATFNDSIKVDLPFWIGFLEKYISDSPNAELREMASYEKIVCSLRGKGTLEGCDQLISDYFANIDSVTSISHLERLQIILSYLRGAVAHAACTLPVETILSWKERVEHQIENELKNDCSPSKKISLLRIRGTLATFDGDTPEEAIEHTVVWWEQILPELENSPYFPLESFSDQITQYIELLGGSPRLDAIAERVDLALSNRVSNSTAAEKSRDRAIAYYKNGTVIRAISLLHNAAIKWHQKETLKGSLLSLILLSNWYSELKLSYASKYYSMAAFRMAFHNKDSTLGAYLPQITNQLSAAEYQAGNWLSFLETSKLFMLVYSAFDNAPGEHFLFDGASQRVCAHVSLLAAITELLNPSMAERIKGKIAELEQNDILNETIEYAKNQWKGVSREKMIQAAREDLSDVPFGDTGSERTIQWSQFGISFKVTFSNTKEVAAAAEAFVAVLQIVFLDLTEEFDLRLLPGESEIAFRLAGSDNKTNIEQEPSNVIYKWKVYWPALWDDEKVPERLAAAFQIISEVSLCPMKELFCFLDVRMKAGLGNKIFLAGSYEDLLKSLGYLDSYDNELRYSLSPLFSISEFTPSCHSLLEWPRQIAPEYSADKIGGMLKRRYEYARKSIRFTLPRLLKEQGFVDLIKRLRNEGWLDWQILACVASIAINYRLNKVMEKREQSLSEFQKLFSNQFERAEGKDELEVPLSTFTYENMNNCLQLNLGSTFKGMGYEMKRLTPNLKGMIEFARHRLRYFEDDIEHEDFLTNIKRTE